MDLRGQVGSQAVEFLGLLPLLFLVAAAGWQFILAAYSVGVAESATRDAARAAAVAPPDRVEAEARRALLAAAGNLPVLRIEVRLGTAPPARRVPGLSAREVDVRAWFAVPLVRLGPARAPSVRVTVLRRAVMPWEGAGAR